MRFQAVTALAMLCVLGAVSLAQAATKEELQTRFEQRYPAILDYKTQGKVGETTQGLLETVKAEYRDDSTLAKLIADENTDRQELYRIIAEETKTTPEKVAERMARRNYEKARPGEWLKTASGEWKQKS